MGRRRLIFCRATDDVWSIAVISGAQQMIRGQNWVRERFGKYALLAALGLAAVGNGGCETKAGTGALVGGAAGAGIGAIVGHNSHNRTASGALIGGAVGAIGGALVGNEMDKADRKKAEEDRYRDQRDSSRDDRSNYSSARVTQADVISWSNHRT